MEQVNNVRLIYNPNSGLNSPFPFVNWPNFNFNLAFYDPPARGIRNFNYYSGFFGTTDSRSTVKRKLLEHFKIYTHEDFVNFCELD